MDYKEIILDGFFNPSTRTQLKEYFIRQYKKAEKERHYTIEEFFKGCMFQTWEIEKVITTLFEKYKSQKLSKELELKKNRMNANTSNPTQLNQEEIDNVKFIEDMVLIKHFPADFSIYYPNKHNKYFKYSNLTLIKNKLDEAMLSLQPKVEPQPSIIEPLDFNLNQTDIVHFFDLLVDASVIEEPSNDVHRTKGGFYGKLSQYFTAKGKPINSNSAKTTKYNKKERQLSYSKSYFRMLKDLKNEIERKLKN